jgi:alpha-N-arabinofuranosidase
MAIPEFILRKLYVPDSFRSGAEGFCFALSNTFAPATLTGIALEVDGQPVPPEKLTVQGGEGKPRTAAGITPGNPFPLSVGLVITVQGSGVAVSEGRLAIRANTREMGQLAFSIQAGARAGPVGAPRPRRLSRLLQRPLVASVEVDAGEVIGEINPWVYGQFTEHLERCVYDGIWTRDGSALREDTVALVGALAPPLIRYPGGNFASGYHWEDGIGPSEARPRRFDAAWNAPESNRVGTDEFLAFCVRVGAEPFLVVNDGSGTAEEAARWVGYCNEPPDGEQGRRRAAHGHPAPHDVRLWGVGNEVWGRWQIGHADALAYVARLREFVTAMRAADPGAQMQVVAVGDGVLGDEAGDPGRLWNEAVLRGAGDCIDHLSFHIYQPDKESWQEIDDLEALHGSVSAAPLDVEAMIRRMAAQIAHLAPGRRVSVALDEWNLWLPPPPEAQSMHQVVYTQRDALYVAGMLNVFHRQCRTLSLANLAQLVNVLPLIVTGEERAVPTALYYPFLLYRRMERLALEARVHGPAFDSEQYGSIRAHRDVPYVDATATCDPERRRTVLGVANRHPARKVRLRIALRGAGRLRPTGAWLMSGPHPLAANTLAAPQQVGVRQVSPPALRGDCAHYELPPCSVAVFEMREE